MTDPPKIENKKNQSTMVTNEKEIQFYENLYNLNSEVSNPFDNTQNNAFSAFDFDQSKVDLSQIDPNKISFYNTKFLSTMKINFMQSQNTTLKKDLTNFNRENNFDLKDNQFSGYIQKFLENNFIDIDNDQSKVNQQTLLRDEEMTLMLNNFFKGINKKNYFSDQSFEELEILRNKAAEEYYKIFNFRDTLNKIFNNIE